MRATYREMFAPTTSKVNWPWLVHSVRFTRPFSRIYNPRSQDSRIFTKLYLHLNDDCLAWFGWNYIRNNLVCMNNLDLFFLEGTHSKQRYITCWPPILFSLDMFTVLFCCHSISLLLPKHIPGTTSACTNGPWTMDVGLWTIERQLQVTSNGQKTVISARVNYTFRSFWGKRYWINVSPQNPETNTTFGLALVMNSSSETWVCTILKKLMSFARDG